ncbi:GGDEF domain-containing protein [Marinobacter sp.]|uniref:GGDEF domain-containing protein n=1 Tax=Marinobacter sp. TaxID=50741 RepID=UPI003566E1E9
MALEKSWKKKYKQALKEAEQQEYQCQIRRELLERMLVRTSVASEGQRPELDRLLLQLREDLRRQTFDVEAWKHLQDQIDREIALLDDGKLRASNHAGAPKPEASMAGHVGIDISDQDNRMVIARRVGQLLGQLIDKVVLEPATEAKAKALQQSLLSSTDWEVLRAGLNHVADLVIEAVTRNQRELEAFLKRLNNRLEVLREHVSEQSASQLSRKDDTAALDRDIREELSLVTEDLETSQDLESLKQSVGQRLDQIGHVLGEFKQRESERENLMAQQLESMQQKVTALETHSEKMQVQIRKERARAMTDLLTQLPNREAWQERLLFEYSRWQRYRHPLTISVIDIDLFKRVNDSYGHKAGDRVLQLVARELRGRLRTTDFIARFGGEEFVVLLPETGMEEAVSVMDELRGHVSRLPFHFGGQPVTITFSSGLAEFREGDTEEGVFDRADQALYQAKKAGRNQVAAS